MAHLKLIENINILIAGEINEEQGLYACRINCGNSDFGRAYGATCAQLHTIYPEGTLTGALTECSECVRSAGLLLINSATETSDENQWEDDIEDAANVDEGSVSKLDFNDEDTKLTELTYTSSKYDIVVEYRNGAYYIGGKPMCYEKSIEWLNSFDGRVTGISSCNVEEYEGYKYADVMPEYQRAVQSHTVDKFIQFMVIARATYLLPLSTCL